MKEEGPIKGYRKALWTGLTTLQLAKSMEQAARLRIAGLYNMVYSEPITKFDLLKLFNRYLRDSRIKIEPYDDFVINKSLKRTNFDFDYIIPDYEKMIFEMAEWMMKHKKIYPHYNL